MTATATLAKLYEAFTAGDGEALAALIGDTQWVEAAGGPYGGTYHGLGEIAANVFQPIGRDVEGFTAVPDEILPVGDDRAIALGTYRGTTPAGPFATRIAHLATVSDGKISRFEQFTDTHEWREAVDR